MASPFWKKPKKVNMTTPIRALPDINSDYQNKCARAGELQFRIKTMESELFQLNQDLAKLHVEYTNTQKAQKEEELKSAPKPTEAQPAQA